MIKLKDLSHEEVREISTTIIDADNKLTTKNRVYAEKYVEIRRTQKSEYEGIRANM